MSSHLETGGDPVARIIKAWVSEYEREVASEDGDPDALIQRVRALAEDARPETATHQALAGFLEVLDLSKA